MEITFEPKENYIYVYAEGEIDIQTAKEFFVRLLGICTEYKIFKVIVDYREVSGHITLIARLDYLKTVDELHKSYLYMGMPKLSIAYLAPKNIDLAELAVLNRRELSSFDNFATHDIESAEKWVMRNAGHP